MPIVNSRSPDVACAVAAGVAVAEGNRCRALRRNELIRLCRARGFEVSADKPGTFYRDLLLRRSAEDAVLAEAARIRIARGPQAC